MSERLRCAAASRCTNYVALAGTNGETRRCGRRVWGLPSENTACGNVTCCEDCALIHARECEVRVRFVQRSVIAHVVKRTEYVHQDIEYILRSDVDTFDQTLTNQTLI